MASLTVRPLRKTIIDFQLYSYAYFLLYPAAMLLQPCLGQLHPEKSSGVGQRKNLTERRVALYEI